MVQNKESLEKFVLKDVHVEDRGEEMVHVMRNKSHKIDLKVIHIENVNLSEKGLRQIII